EYRRICLTVCQQLDALARGTVAAPRLRRRNLRRVAGPAGDQVLMRDVARTAVRREGVVAECILLRERPVWLNLVLKHVRVDVLFDFRVIGEDPALWMV